MADERYIALGNMASGVAKALQTKADREYEEKKANHDLISKMVSSGIESGTIQDPDAAFKFLINGGKPAKGKKAELPPMLQTLIGSTKHLFGGGGQPSEADQVAGRMASAQPQQSQQPSQPQAPHFLTTAERDAQSNASTINLEKRRDTEITAPAEARRGTEKLKEIEATNKARYGPGTLVGRVQAEMEAFRQTNGREPDATEQAQLADKARGSWQSAGRKESDYKTFEDQWLKDAAGDTTLTAGQQKAEMLKAHKAWSLQESSADKLNRAKALEKYKSELSGVSSSDVKDLSQTITIGDASTGYLDLSAIAGVKEKNAASKAAIAQGIIPVTGKQAEQLEAAGAASGNLKDFMAAVQARLPKDASGRPIAALENKLSQFFQTDEELSASMAWDTSVLPMLRAMQVSGRITNLEFQTALNARPKITDTLGTAQKKVGDINKMFTRATGQILTRGQGGSGAPKTPAAGTVPADVQGALTGKKPGHYKLRNGTEWDVDAKGTVTAANKKAA